MSLWAFVSKQDPIRIVSPSHVILGVASVFCLRDAIIIAESQLSAPVDDFLSTLVHERMHRELFRLESDERDLLENAAHAFLHDRHGIHLMMNPVNDIANASIHESWQEFYCHAVTEEVDSRVMSDFHFEYPEASFLFQRLEDKCRRLTKLD